MTEARAPSHRPRPLELRARRRWLRRGPGLAPRGDVARPTHIGLWLPLTPLWLLLAPFALLLAPALALAPPTRGISPYRAVLSIGAVLLALSGTVVEVDAPGAVIRIRIF